MDDWKRTFAEKLGQAQARWAGRLDEVLDNTITPVFKDLDEFLQTNGMSSSMPLHEPGRRSYKFELAEDAYVLLLICSRGMGEVEVTRETFVLGQRPVIRKTGERVGALTAEWAEHEFTTALDGFVEQLANATPSEAPAEMPVG